MRLIRTLLGFVQPFPWVLPATVVLGLSASLAEGIGIGLLIPFLDGLLRGTDTAAGSEPVAMLAPTLETLVGEATPGRIGALIVALIMVKALLTYLKSALTAWVNGRISHTLRVRLMREMLDVGYAFVTRSDLASLLNTVVGETWRVVDALNSLFTLIISACAAVVFAAILLTISWQLTLGIAFGVLAVSTAVRVVTRRTQRLGKAAVEANQSLAERSVETIYGMRMVRMFGQEDREQARFTDASEAVRKSSLRVDLLSAIPHPMLEVLYVPLFLVPLLMAGRMGVSVPMLLAFLLLLYRLQPHIKTIDYERVQLSALDAAVADVAAMLDRRDKPWAASGTVPFRGLSRGLSLHEVGFSYGENGEGRAALADVSFEIAKGEVTAIIGGSGAGKSTLINLIYRLYDPTTGTILVDGVPLRDLDLAVWRQRLAFAGQDNELFDATVLENITYANPGASRHAVAEAARLADAHDFIKALPEGYDTRVGERGMRLSGGQRQRIGLARALLCKPDILILDEATNSLDSLTEAAIQETLERLRGRMTMIVIAHRLSTIRNADRVVVLQEGRVTEHGRPADLFQANGMFTKLYRLQAPTLLARH